MFKFLSFFNLANYNKINTLRRVKKSIIWWNNPHFQKKRKKKAFIILTNDQFLYYTYFKCECHHKLQTKSR